MTNESKLDSIKAELTTIAETLSQAQDKEDMLNELRHWVHTNLSTHSDMPIDHVLWVPIEKVEANDYNPNSVAKTEMKLLHTSISHDGYTQPIVTIQDPVNGKYIIVDGFHRYSTMRINKDIMEKTGGRLPIVVIKKDINDRMASTVRHNRARGKHAVNGMASMVFSMLDNGWKDDLICKELSMEAEELVRLKHITGFSKLFENVEYQLAWETKHQINLKKQYQNEQQQAANGQADETI